MARKFQWNPKGQPQEIEGTEDADEIFGGNGNQHFRGLGGDDYLYSGNGNDVLEGGDGNDTLIGAAGADMLSGGSGSDTFVFANHWHWTDWTNDTPNGMDTITDFEASDFIDLSGVSSGDVTSFAQISLEPIAGGNIVHVDVGGLDSNDMHIVVLGETPTEADFVF